MTDESQPEELASNSNTDEGRGVAGADGGLVNIDDPSKPPPNDTNGGGDTTPPEDPEASLAPVIAWWTKVMGVCAIVSVCVGTIQWCAMNGQLKVMRDQIALEHPPHLAAANFEVWPTPGKEDTRVILIPGAKLSGKFPLIATGGDTAVIEYMWCEVDWLPNLPAYRPFFGIPKHPCDNFGSTPANDAFKASLGPTGPREGKVTEFPMRAGDGAMWEWHTIVPTLYSPDTKLYVWGAVRYRDSMKVEHAYVFARRYDPALGIFTTETNPDYQTEY